MVLRVNEGRALWAYRGGLLTRIDAGGEAPPPASGVIFEDLTSVASGSSYLNSRTIAHTSLGEDRLVLVFVATRQNLIESVTYGGTPMTLLSAATAFENDVAGISTYFLLNPPNTSQNVVISLGSNYVLFSTAIISYSNVDQETPLASGGAAVASWASLPSLSVPTDVADAKIVHAINTNSTSEEFAVNGSSGDLRLLLASGDVSLGRLGVADLDRTALSGSVGWSAPSGANYALAAIALNPAA